MPVVLLRLDLRVLSESKGDVEQEARGVDGEVADEEAGGREHRREDA